MKNLLRAIFFLAIISCQPTATEEVAEEPPFEVQDSSPSMYAVSLESAKENINFYDSISKEVLGVDPIRAFTIRSVDLVESIGLDMKYLRNAKYRHVRIYMGLDSASGEFKVYLTPVSGANLSAGKPGKDVILDGPYSGNDKTEGELGDGNGPYVFDFSKPCPTTCPDNILQ